MYAKEDYMQKDVRCCCTKDANIIEQIARAGMVKELEDRAVRSSLQIAQRARCCCTAWGNTRAGEQNIVHSASTHNKNR